MPDRPVPETAGRTEQDDEGRWLLEPCLRRSARAGLTDQGTVDRGAAKRLLNGGIFSRSAGVEQPKSLRHPASYGVRDCPRKPSRQGFDDGVDRLESVCGEIVEDRLNERIGDAQIPGLHKMAQAKEREFEHVAPGAGRYGRARTEPI